MKKSLIALATLVAFAGAASAQSSVTIGGFVDLGFGKNTGTSDKAIQDGGGADASRLNFNAIEDLGGGLTAIAGFEHRFKPDTGASASNFWNGYSFVGLQSGFGRIKIGRDYTAAFSLAQNQVDPFGGDTVAALRGASLTPGVQKTRFANGIRYDSPAMGGLTFAFDISEKGQSASDANKPWSAGVAYAAGPMYLALSHENPGGTNDKLTNLAARYTMGNLTLRAGVANGTNNDNAKVKGYLIGANYAMGAGNFKIGYATNKTSGYTAVADLPKNQTNAKRFAVGYQYNLSKRTFLYTDFVRDSQLTTQRTGYDFGVRHQF